MMNHEEHEGHEENLDCLVFVYFVPFVVFRSRYHPRLQSMIAELINDRERKGRRLRVLSFRSVRLLAPIE